MEDLLLSGMVKDRACYDVFKESGHTLSDLGKAVYKIVDEVYTRDACLTSVPKDLLDAMIAQRTENAKHASLFHKLVDKAYSGQVSVDNIVALIKEDQTHRLSIELYDAAAKRDTKKVRKILDQLHSLDMAEAEDEELVSITTGSDIMDLVHRRLNRSNLISVATDTLTDWLGGGILGGHHVICFARPECFSEDTDILTQKGWMSFPELAASQEPIAVAQVTKTGAIEFVTPSRIIQQYRDEPMVHIYNRKKQVDMLVTEGHDVVYLRGGEWRKKSAGALRLQQWDKIPTASTAVTDSQEELSAEDVLRIAYQADGRTRVYKTCGWAAKTHSFGYEINLKKERKRDRLSRCLEDLVGRDVVRATVFPCRQDTYEGYYITTDLLMDKDFSWIDLTKITQGWARAFLLELMYWDGSRRSETRWKYSNTNKEACDKVQAVAAIAGWPAFLSSVPDKRGFPTCYEVHIREADPVVGGQSIITEKVPYAGMVYCVTVPSGMVMVRRNNKMFVSGNCGKSAFGITCAQRFVKQGLRGIYLLNEDRRDDIELRFIQAALEKPAHWLKDPANTDWVREKLGKMHYQERMLYADCNPGTLVDIEKMFKKYEPQWFVCDQLRNIDPGKSESNTHRLDFAARSLRDLLKKYNVAGVSLTQAGDSASGKAVLDMSDIDSSKTGIPAACDVLCGIGVTPELMSVGQRTISLVKNKMPEGKGHGYFNVAFHQQISKFKDIA